MSEGIWVAIIAQAGAFLLAWCKWRWEQGKAREDREIADDTIGKYQRLVGLYESRCSSCPPASTAPETTSTGDGGERA